ncbi:MAG: hypothetical protein LUK37_08240 [Clostridia bacterium]|nr:hypothetical protein [Clostridia bacterium]
MKEKRRCIPVLILSFILIVLYTAGMSRWHRNDASDGETAAAEISDSVKVTASVETRASDRETASAPTRASDREPSSAPTKAPDTAPPFPITIPQLLVTYGPDKTEIPYSSGGYQLYMPGDDGTKTAVIACGAEPLSYLAEKEQDIPYVKLGTDISLEFREGTVPDHITVQDLILRGDGSPKYNEQATEEFSLACFGGAACFSLDINRTALLSSDMSTYKEAGILRGFRVNCRWNDNSTAEYGFVIRTDASSTENQNLAD